MALVTASEETPWFNMRPSPKAVSVCGRLHTAALQGSRAAGVASFGIRCGLQEFTRNGGATEGYSPVDARL